MDSASFVKLVRELQALGAVHVRAGEYECSLSPPGPMQLDPMVFPQSHEEEDPDEKAKQYIRDHYASALPRGR
jgi:hypothetical protein